MDFQLWNFANPSNMFSSTQKGPFASNVSSYFRRPSKVVKPPSRNNSPRMSSRRRMTTSGHPSRTQSVIDYQRMSMPLLLDSQHLATRPISWHPNTMEGMTQFPPSEHLSSESLMTTPYTTAEANGLVTPMSYPLVDEPQIQELITPLESLSAHESMSQYGYGADAGLSQYWVSQQSKDTVDMFDSSMYNAVGYSTWYGDQQYSMSNVPTAPTSPAYLPMPEFGGPLEIEVAEAENESEELVAMGLYDSPADVQSSSMLFGGISGTPARRTLKLEDAFEPSPPSDDDDDDDEDDDEDDGTAEDDDEFCGQQVEPQSMEAGPVNAQQKFSTDISQEQYKQMMGNSYIVNQWHAPGQSQYNWI